jgi:hypothetical protein
MLLCQPPREVFKVVVRGQDNSSYSAQHYLSHAKYATGGDSDDLKAGQLYDLIMTWMDRPEDYTRKFTVEWPQGNANVAP